MAKQTIIETIKMFRSFLDIVIFIRILASWIPDEYKDNVFMRLVYDFTEPILRPIRNLINKSSFGGPGIMIDFSPIIASIGIHFLSQILIAVIVSL